MTRLFGVTGVMVWSLCGVICWTPPSAHAFALLPNDQKPSPDWVEAELTLMDFPSGPSPELAPDRVAMFCLRSLQFVDHPTPLAGLDRIFPFLTWECRGSVTSRGGIDDTIDKFRERAALSPMLQPFMGATRIELGDGTLSPGTATRGDVMSYSTTVHGASVLAFQHKSGLIRDRVAAGPPRTDMVIRLEKARRPPVTGCWLVRDIVDVRFAKGGQGWSRHEGV